MGILLSNVIKKINKFNMTILYQKDNTFVLQCNKHKYHVYKVSLRTIRGIQWSGCKFCNGEVLHIVDKMNKIQEYCNNNNLKFIRIVSAKTNNPSFLIKNIDGKEYVLRYHQMKNRKIPLYNSTIYTKELLCELALSNNLEVLNIDDIDFKKVKTSTRFRCKCLKCGKIYDKTITYLKEGHGCYYCKRNAHTRDEEYNMVLNICKNKNYQLLSSLSEFDNREMKLKILCKNHNEVFYQKAYLMIRRGYGCPLCKMTAGEKVVADYLKENNISFETQKRFDDLFGLGGGYLRYDFYIPSKNLLIEYQGEQHYSKFRWEKNDEKLKIRQKHDQLKREYAKNNKIHMIEIKYNENITEKLKEVLKWI